MQLCSWQRAVCHTLRTGTTPDKIRDEQFQILIGETAQLILLICYWAVGVLSSATLIFAVNFHSETDKNKLQS